MFVVVWVFVVWLVVGFGFFFCPPSAVFHLGKLEPIFFLFAFLIFFSFKSLQIIVANRLQGGEREQDPTQCRSKLNHLCVE